MPPFFFLAVVTLEFDAGFDFASFWQQVEQVGRVPTLQEFTAAIAWPPLPTPRELPQGANYRALGPVEDLPPMPALELVPYPETPEYRPEPRPGEPGCGYVAESPPLLPPEFVPDTVPPDPIPDLLPLPTPPSLTPADCSVDAVRRYRNLTQCGEYRIARWASLVTLVIAVVLWVGQSRFSAGCVTLFGTAGFGGVWLILWVRARRELHRNLLTAGVEQERERAQIAEVRRKFTDRFESVERENNHRTAAVRQATADLHLERERLPVVNAEKRRLYDVAFSAVQQEILVVRQRNLNRRQQYEDAAAAADVERHREWKLQAAKTQTERGRIARENQELQNQWDRLLPRHNARVRAIADLNARRVAARQQYDRHLAVCKAKLADTQSRLNDLVSRWAVDRAVLVQRWQDNRRSLSRSGQKYLDLKASFEGERDQLTSHALQNQLDDHLRRQLIEQATIPEIGKTRKAKLLAFGIETAYDIADHRLAAVRGEGFGPQRLGNLRAWRAECENTFVFDPTKQIASAALRNLHLKYQSERLSIRNALRAGLRHSEDYGIADKSRFEEFQQLGTLVAADVVQAQVDLQVVQLYAGA